MIMEASERTGSFTTFGWIANLVGCSFWTYGYFLGEPGSLINWPAVSLSWIADYLPNWQSEAGTFLMLVASIPIYYAQFQASREKE